MNLKIKLFINLINKTKKINRLYKIQKMKQKLKKE